MCHCQNEILLLSGEDTGSPRQGTVQNLDVVQIIFMKGDGMESMPGTTVVELEFAKWYAASLGFWEVSLSK